MANALRGLFSVNPGFDRVNIPGLIVMLCGVLLLLLSGTIAGFFPAEKRESAKTTAKLLSLAVCAAGFAIALY